MLKIDLSICSLRSSILRLTSGLYFKQLIRRFTRAQQQLTLIGVRNMDSLTQKEKYQENGSENGVAKQEGKYLKTENPLDGRQLQNILPDVSTLLKKAEEGDSHEDKA